MTDIAIDKKVLESALDAVLLSKQGWLPGIGAVFPVTFDAHQHTIVAEILRDALHQRPQSSAQ